jgi:hypothetical protein
VVEFLTVSLFLSQCLVSESIMYKEQVTELRSELNRVKDESQGVKEKYYAQVNQVYSMRCLRF